MQLTEVKDIRTGVLLYYDNDTVSPMWHQCDAFLTPPNLRLTYFTPSGKPVTRTILVANGMDARSIASTNCAAIPPPMLDGKSPYVFEVEFANSITEKFAAISALERGGWVSSVWYVLETKLSMSMKLTNAKGIRFSRRRLALLFRPFII